MQTTTTNPTPPNQYFRKVKTDGTFKKTFKVLGLYFTVSNCRVKKRISCGYSRQGHEGKLIWQAKQRLYKEHEGRCPHCGRKFDFDVMELHHVLPYARFQDLITDERNLLLLCHDCHKEVHCNPFLNIRLMQAKADELGIDLHDRYDYDGRGSDNNDYPRVGGRALPHGAMVVSRPVKHLPLHQTGNRGTLP